ncbi:MAG: electron transport complex subunit RsxB [Thioalkalispiraceae bacterium]|jgi:electron transport complex protein RnfB
MEIILLTILALIFGISLGYVAIRFRVEGDPIVDQVDAILPQTQCAQCGYPGCRPYAEAIVKEEAQINQCPPGGEDGVQALADLLGREVLPLNPENGVVDEGLPMIAVINEQTCIGCTKCVQVCPVDAIVGAAKHKHNVIHDYCTGCELCLPPLCPVEDCIQMQPIEQTVHNWKWSLPAANSKDRAA